MNIYAQVFVRVPIDCFFLAGPAACRILVPQAGIEPWPFAVKAWSPNRWTAREFPHIEFQSIKMHRGMRDNFGGQ